MAEGAALPVAVAAAMPWHRTQWSRLAADLESGTLHHALLLSGPIGIGKRALADALLATLICEQRSPEGACGRCRGCHLLAAGTHPDVLRVMPEEPGKQIRIAQVRDELVEFVVRTASIASVKVVLIDPAEAMNHSTANSLLKSLEEPSPGTHLILVCDAPSRLLATIRSRCRHLKLSPPDWSEARRWLVSRRGEQDSDDLLGIASGCPLSALRLGEGNALERFDRAAELIRASARPGVWVSSLASSVSDMDLRELLGWMQIYLVDLGRWMADPAASRLPRAQLAHAALAPTVAASAVALQLRDTISAARDAASTANPNRQLLLESLLDEWSVRVGGAARLRQRAG